MRKKLLVLAVTLFFFSICVLLRSLGSFSTDQSFQLTVTPTCGLYGNYCYIPFYASSESNLSPNDKVVTLCTQSTPDFLHHLATLCSSWNGPISLAIYCEEQRDLDFTQIAMLTLRQCNECVRLWVDWHVFYGINHQILGHFDVTYNTSDVPDCDWLKVPMHSTKFTRTGSYPINVGRNLAKRLAKSPYIFSNDIELFPSQGAERRLKSMLQSRPTNNSNRREVYVFPVFEVWSRFQVPRNKEELRNMFHRKQAISFHKYRCWNCHLIPDLGRWMNVTSPATGGSTNQAFQIWRTVKRNKRFKLNFWEPFFVAPKDLPEFDPRLTWEGKQNKMQLAYEMCLMDYDFHILDEAFLCHAPGVNVYNAAKERFRAKYETVNLKHMNSIRRELITKHGRREGC